MIRLATAHRFFTINIITPFADFLISALRSSIARRIASPPHYSLAFRLPAFPPHFITWLFLSTAIQYESSPFHCITVRIRSLPLHVCSVSLCALPLHFATFRYNSSAARTLHCYCFHFHRSSSRGHSPPSHFVSKQVLRISSLCLSFGCHRYDAPRSAFPLRIFPVPLPSIATLSLRRAVHRMSFPRLIKSIHYSASADQVHSLLRLCVEFRRPSVAKPLSKKTAHSRCYATDRFRSTLRSSAIQLPASRDHPLTP